MNCKKCNSEIYPKRSDQRYLKCDECKHKNYIGIRDTATNYRPTETTIKSQPISEAPLKSERKENVAVIQVEVPQPEAQYRSDTHKPNQGEYYNGHKRMNEEEKERFRTEGNIVIFITLSVLAVVTAYFVFPAFKKVVDGLIAKVKGESYPPLIDNDEETDSEFMNPQIVETNGVSIIDTSDPRIVHPTNS